MTTGREVGTAEPGGPKLFRSGAAWLPPRADDGDWEARSIGYGLSMLRFEMHGRPRAGVKDFFPFMHRGTIVRGWPFDSRANVARTLAELSGARRAPWRRIADEMARLWPCTFTTRCEGRIHRVTVTPRGRIRWHNHNPKEVAKLHRAAIVTGVYCGCVNVLRWMARPVGADVPKHNHAARAALFLAYRARQLRTIERNSMPKDLLAARAEGRFDE